MQHNYFDKYIQVLEKRSASGDKISQYELSVIYCNPSIKRYVEVEKGRELLLDSASQHHMQAIERVYYLYLSGDDLANKFISSILTKPKERIISKNGDKNVQSNKRKAKSKENVAQGQDNLNRQLGFIRSISGVKK
jgi:hypothetical protein